MEWILWAYPAVGALTVVPFARYYKLDHPRASVTDSAFIAWASSLIWPIMALIYGTGYLLTLDKRRAEALERGKMSLATAQEVIRQHELAERKERDARNQRLRDNWTKLSGIETHPAPTGWYRAARKLSTYKPRDYSKYE